MELILNVNIVKNKLDIYLSLVDKEVPDFEIARNLNVTGKSCSFKKY